MCFILEPSQELETARQMSMHTIYMISILLNTQEYFIYTADGGQYAYTQY